MALRCYMDVRSGVAPLVGYDTITQDAGGALVRGNTFAGVSQPYLAALPYTVPLPKGLATAHALLYGPPISVHTAPIRALMHARTFALYNYPSSPGADGNVLPNPYHVTLYFFLLNQNNSKERRTIL